MSNSESSIESLVPNLDLAPLRIDNSGYDPVDELVNRDRELEALIALASNRQNPSMVAIAALMAQRVAIGKELAKYRYRPAVSIKDSKSGDDLPNITIGL